MTHGPKETKTVADPKIKEALLYEKLGKGHLRCGTCERFCEIPPNTLGFCKTRKNINSTLHTLVYGDVASLSVNPIEKKPFFHFYPGSRALTIGTWSCNFTCPWCQNWALSKSHPGEKRGTYISPAEFVKLIRRYDCEGTSLSFNEPTLLLEYALDVFDRAGDAGYYNTFVSNGYMSEKALTLLAEHGLNAMNIDIKGDKRAVYRYGGADGDKVWRNAVGAKERGIHIEITTLVIPGVNDSEACFKQIAKRIKNELGKDTPWHLSAYYPSYQFDTPPTPVTTLELGRHIALTEGLTYVYMGNVPGHPHENTYCPRCETLLIERDVFEVRAYHITAHKACPACQEAIPMVGHLIDR